MQITKLQSECPMTGTTVGATDYHNLARILFTELLLQFLN
jgi:hypothetical protein